MSWGKVDDKLPEHPKWTELERKFGPRRWADALATWVVVLCYANRNETDGEIEATLLSRISPLGKAAVKAAEALVDVRLMERTDYGFRIYSFTDYNPSKAKKEAERAADARRKATGRGAGVVTESEQESGRNPTGVHPLPIPIPIPSPGGEEISPPPPPRSDPSSLSLLDVIRTRWALSFERARGQIAIDADEKSKRELARVLRASAKTDHDATGLLDALLGAYWAEPWPRDHKNTPSLRNVISQGDRLIARLQGPKPPGDDEYDPSTGETPVTNYQMQLHAAWIEDMHPRPWPQLQAARKRLRT